MQSYQQLETSAYFGLKHPIEPNVSERIHAFLETLHYDSVWILSEDYTGLCGPLTDINHNLLGQNGSK
jgi:hypothetical protein